MGEMKKRRGRRAYTWQTMREGGSSGDVVEAFSEVIMESAMAFYKLLIEKGFEVVLETEATVQVFTSVLIHLHFLKDNYTPCIFA